MTDRATIATVRRFESGTARTDQDLVAVEAPLNVELRFPAHDTSRALGVLMRTPGDDRALVLGLLFAEGLIDRVTDVVDVALVTGEEDSVTARVTLAAHLEPSPHTSARALPGTSACGLCGRLEMTRIVRPPVLAGSPRLSYRPAIVSAMQERLRQGQAIFSETGGLHAAGLFDAHGDLVILREDVGRHNAVDKLVGALLEAGRLPAFESALAVSGRVAYEIVQKAARAGVPIIVAVGAPSSLAVDAARAAGLTLIGFARDGRFNVYSGFERVEAPVPDLT